MSDTLEALRARVEAAQALAAKATPGPWGADVDRGDLGDRVSVLRLPSGAPDDAGDMLAEVWTGKGPDGHLMAAAPDLVTLAADLLALAESQAEALTDLQAEVNHLRDVCLLMRPRCGKVIGERRVQAATFYDITCGLPAGHEGPHAEALGDAGGDGGGR
jgi:hypothetical protein